MTQDILSFSTSYEDFDPSRLVLREVKGREAMSSLYEYELTFEADTAEGLAWEVIDGLLSNTCFFAASGSRTVEVHGVLRKMELLEPTLGTPARYRALLVPGLWSTTRSYRSRVYQGKDVQGLVDTVLAGHGLEAEWHLGRGYPESEYTVQYEESDFDFLSRQLEHWGIYYYFRQESDGERLVIADHRMHLESLPGYETLTYNPRLGRSGVAGSVHAIRAVIEPQPAVVMEREYNWRTPTTQLAVGHPVDRWSGHGLQWYYGDHFKDEEQGKLLASIRAEQMLNLRETYDGICSVPGLCPGHKFELLDCPVPELNITYLVTGVEPRIAVDGDGGDESYQYRFTAVALERDAPEVVPYRSQRRTPKPQIHGFMHGFVDGEARGAAAPIDELGRYTIILPMDAADAEENRLPGKASRKIRMAQASAGQNYGIHFPLHVGTEVAIIHLDGDPDRPVIMASIPNAETVSPVVQDNATQSRIKSRTGILIELDDDLA